MTNILKTFGIFAIMALLISLFGCKKDEDPASFTLEVSSFDFEYDQTKETSYFTDKIGTIEIRSVPDGWQCVRSGHRFIITSPSASDSSAELKGNINVSGAGADGIVITRSIEVAVRIAEEIPSPANSYIVSAPDKRYKFNARRRGHETSETLPAAKAIRLWSTSHYTIRNVSLENGYIYFSTGDYNQLVEGNAVIAVLDNNNNILWSWHIWVVADDPTTAPDIVAGIIVMNRNLGAFLNSTTGAFEVRESYGLYYQWGRKDPFIGPSAWDSSVFRSIYDSEGDLRNYNYVVSDDKTGTVEYATLHPDTFIAGNEKAHYHWLASPDNDLWGADGVKTLYDPCPAGWRVAPPTIWASFTANVEATTDPAQFNVEGDYNYGWTFLNGDKKIYYPAAGRRSFSPTLASHGRNFTNVVNDEYGVGRPVGFYWSNTSPTPSLVTTLYPPPGTGTLAFRHDYINPGAFSDETAETAAAGGFPLRCVAE